MKHAILYWAKHRTTGEVRRHLTERSLALLLSSPLWELGGPEPMVIRD